MQLGEIGRTHIGFHDLAALVDDEGRGREAHIAPGLGHVAGVVDGVMGFGISMVLGGVVQLLSPQQTYDSAASERPENRPSYNFNGPVNTTAQGHPVPLCYGRMIVGSAVISAGIETRQQA